MNLSLQPTDSFTKSGAEKLARTIRDFWASKGHAVATRVEDIAGQENMWAVRSDLKAGRPAAVGLAGFNASKGGFVKGPLITVRVGETPSEQVLPRALGVFRL